MWSATDSDWCTFHCFIEQMVFFFFHFTRVEAYLKFDRNEILATNFEEKKIIENKSSKRHLATSKKNSKQQNLFSLLQHVSKDSGVSHGKKEIAFRGSRNQMELESSHDFFRANPHKVVSRCTSSTMLPSSRLNSLSLSFSLFSTK